MIRKTMEDVVVHNSDASQLAQSSKHKPEIRKTAYSYEDETAQGKERIESNPFFEKPRSPKTEQPTKNKSRAALWVFATVILLGTALFVANYFSSATVEITPVTYHGHIENDFIATKDAATASSTDSLLFHFISLTDQKSKDVPATIEKQVQNKASGEVTIYNAYSSSPQRLIKNTRLESADHKIFRIDQPVVVPGTKTVSGTVVPGSVDVLVYADAVGTEYNIGAGDFTIPGFKGDPRYEKFSARSKPDSLIAGGFSGTVKVPSDADIKSAQDELKTALQPSAIEKARALIPTGMTFFPGSVVLKFEEMPQDFTDTDTAKVTVSATVSVFFFDTDSLTQKFAETALSDYQGNPVSVSNMSTLAFTFINPIDNVVLADLSQVRFHIVGDPVFIGTIDSEKIRTTLAGKNKKDFGSIIVGEQNVGKADATVRPMWKTTFPINPSKIAVKILSN